MRNHKVIQREASENFGFEGDCTHKKARDKRAGARGWWRRRESNPRPRILRRWIYMRSPVYFFWPSGARRAGHSVGDSELGFSGSGPDPHHRDPM